MHGVNNNKSASEVRYTLESLNIKENSTQASIFNAIDLSDGRQEGSLTSEQYTRFQAMLGEDLDTGVMDFINEKISKFNRWLNPNLQPKINKERIALLNNHLDTPLSPNASDKEIYKASLELCYKLRLYRGEGNQYLHRYSDVTRESIISELNKSLETPLSPDATEEEIHQATISFCNFLGFDFINVFGFNSAEAGKNLNADHNEIVKSPIPTKEEIIAKLNERLDVPLSPDATEEEIQQAMQKLR